MPKTSATWLTDVVVNHQTAGDQSNPRVTQLSNGNILVSWDSASQIIDRFSGYPGISDVKGQIFNPLGEPVGKELRLSQGSAALIESGADIAALPDGGFLVVYQDAGPGVRPLVMDRFNADGKMVSTESVAADSPLNPSGKNFPARIAVSSDTSALIVWEQTKPDNESHVLGRIYNASTNTMGPVITLSEVQGVNRWPEVAVLENGNYVLTNYWERNYKFPGAMGAGVTFDIFDSFGRHVFGDETNGGPAALDDLTVAALTGGGFVIASTEGARGGMYGAAYPSSAYIYDNKHEHHESSFPFTYPNADAFASFESEFGRPAIVGLPDGGFLIFSVYLYQFEIDFVYGEENWIIGQRFDANGTPIGNQFVTAKNVDKHEADAVLLADGRVVVTYLNADGEIGMTIHDPRDYANATGVYTRGSWQIGTIADDKITVDSDVSFVAGHDGDDIISGKGPSATYYGGNGNDTLTGDQDGSSADRLFGGNGDDTLRHSGRYAALRGEAGNDQIEVGWQAISQGIKDNGNAYGGTGDDRFVAKGAGLIGNIFGGSGSDTLDLSHVISDNTLEIELQKNELRSININSNFDKSVTFLSLKGVENILGSKGDDHIRADNKDNLLSGNKGRDWLFGFGGNDQLFGEGGNDEISADNGDDQLFGGKGDDGLDGGKGDDTLRGGAGNDTLYGARDADSLFGGAGKDLLFASIYLTDKSGDDLFGGRDADVLLGGWRDDRLFGGEGNDTLWAQNHKDVLDGGSGDDILILHSGAASMTGGAGSDVFVFDVKPDGAEIAILTDFNTAEDTINFDFARVLGGAAGNLGEAFFAANPAGMATDESDRIIYDTETGNLFFDPDGNGALARIHFATLTNKPVLTLEDLTVTRGEYSFNDYY